MKRTYGIAIIICIFLFIIVLYLFSNASKEHYEQQKLADQEIENTLDVGNQMLTKEKNGTIVPFDDTKELNKDVEIAKNNIPEFKFLHSASSYTILISIITVALLSALIPLLLKSGHR